MHLISILQLGTVDYATSLRLQQQFVALRKEEQIGDVLLLLEHKPVITLGRNAKATNVVASSELLAQRGVELFECDRGGDVTFHGPGQIIGYPIFDLRGFARFSTNSNAVSSPADLTTLSSRAEENDPLADRSLQSRDLAFPPRKHLGAVDFVRRLEEVLIRASADFAIPTKRIPGLTGVWTDPDTSLHSNSLSSRAEENDSKSRSLESRACPEQPTEGRASNGDLLFAGTSTTLADTTYREGHGFSRAESDSKRGAALAAEASESKLAAIGIHISRFVTSHGFALNVNIDLSYFDLIVPCGITTKPVTSMQKELGKPLNLGAVAESISRNFGKVFQSQILWLDTLDSLLGRTLAVPARPLDELRKLQPQDDTDWA